MPDSSGRFLGISVNADAWTRIFGPPELLTTPEVKARFDDLLEANGLPRMACRNPFCIHCDGNDDNATPSA